MIRLVVWTTAMSYVGFLFAGKGFYFPLGVTISGAILGAGSGSLLAIMFSSRALRRQESSKYQRR